MKKIVVVFILLAGVAVTGWLLLNKNTKTPYLELAKKNSAAGDMQTALGYFLEAALELVPKQEFPDVNRLQFLPNDALKKEVTKYLEWLATPLDQEVPDAVEALAGITRLVEFDKKEIFPVALRVKEFTGQKYIEAWNGAFYRSGSVPDASLKPLAEGNFKRNLSLVEIECEDNYSYDIVLVNVATSKATTYHLPAQNTARMYALPGRHLLLLKSTITFSTKESWKSAPAVIPLDIPETTSHVSFELRTSVKRKQ